MPLCPFCGSTIMSQKDIRIKRLTSVRDINVVCCSTCDKIIGIE